MTNDGIPMYQFLSTGRVACVVGEVDSSRLRLLHSESPIEVVMVPETEDTETEDTENVGRPWNFNGPDGEPYTWQVMFRSPVLFASNNALVPLARYRHAKLGIISRSRRAFLEIFPAGINVIDLIVITFVSYAKHYWLDELDHVLTLSAV
ncbi:hypothetical protein AZE42_09204 [Rhizopogon vesiculosus]|uniref:DUF6593 domain-containing protein n=1 Tax=Rhizopogon vesiculosus TaxID=180088 RepID=A0A1J8QWR8_9AGAM|nr:hypothetical protein AZE42_09204 [Rhizopogon vesiculosus]